MILSEYTHPVVFFFPGQILPAPVASNRCRSLGPDCPLPGLFCLNGLGYIIVPCLGSRLMGEDILEEVWIAIYLHISPVSKQLHIKVVVLYRRLVQNYKFLKVKGWKKDLNPGRSGLLISSLNF